MSSQEAIGGIVICGLLGILTARFIIRQMFFWETAPAGDEQIGFFRAVEAIVAFFTFWVVSYYGIKHLTYSLIEECCWSPSRNPGSVAFVVSMFFAMVMTVGLGGMAEKLRKSHETEKYLRERLEEAAIEMQKSRSL